MTFYPPLMFSWMTEWKVDMDSPTDTHRHLSHLTGLYPGYSIASYDSKDVPPNVNLTKEQLLDAATTSLIHRGNGTGWDADSGDSSRILKAATFCLFCLSPRLGESLAFSLLGSTWECGQVLL